MPDLIMEYRDVLLFLGIALPVFGLMIWNDMRSEREAGEYWEHEKATRHCVRRPYKHRR